MGWSRIQVIRNESSGYERLKPGRSYKLCPYSSAYREKFKYTGDVCTGLDVHNNPEYKTGDFVMGNSINPNFFALDYDTYVCSEHTTTSGRMFPAMNPPSWMCEDPNCIYFTTLASGNHYREV
jgi:hypothetical protein